MNTLPKNLDENIAAFNSASSKLEEHYAGKYVIYYDGNFEGSFDSFDAAAKHALSRFGVGPYLIRQVGAATSIPMPASVAFRPIYAHS